MGYVLMNEFDRNPELDRESLVAGIAARAMRINDRLLEQSGPGSDQRPGAGLASPPSSTAIHAAVAETPVRSARVGRSR